MSIEERPSLTQDDPQIVGRARILVYVLKNGLVYRVEEAVRYFMFHCPR